jgi:hypothetical protein
MIPILVDFVQLLQNPSVVYVKVTRQREGKAVPYEHQMQTPSLCGQYQKRRSEKTLKSK